jgi:acetyl esterase/lipase
MKKIALLATFLTACSALAVTAAPSAYAQMPVMTMEHMPRPAEPGAIALYSADPRGAKPAADPEVWTKAMGREAWVRNITKPTLTPFLPKKGTGNGAAVLVIPGGGFKFVSISNEGWPVAQWLADRGIAAFVLKYRVEQTPASDADFSKQMMAGFAAPPSGTGPSPEMFKTMDLAREDAQAALRMIRAGAAKWGVDTKRVGMVGFSAGAITTMAVTLANDAAARPDFIAPIYGFMNAVTPPASPQPMFAALASDDILFNKQGFGLVESWQKAGGSVELHYYQGGGHGFGAKKQGTTSDLWIEQFHAWMKAQGLLKPAAK